ncbi:Modulator of Rho-dependent transcription termination [Shewanella piezotolerans WP3]|uniref:Modulator of Rho-dependent transcription termination n=1 Tax=Shewanella piezotolerans (strain WP3 / JCM 13877) TaxID=225849 RepID=B8CM06_SHEPW|nr:Rho-binding antiterminator [Shewanella piezotolerans]ACJ28930.1 Modulator of Rho-dependent transcription termination [Shewanella piezotolerans WP3]
MQQYQAINCHCHDYLELACMRGYCLLLELKQRTNLTATAITLETHSDKTEWLIVDYNGTREAIRLDQILAITPTDTSASFQRINIAL